MGLRPTSRLSTFTPNLETHNINSQWVFQELRMECSISLKINSFKVCVSRSEQRKALRSGQGPECLNNISIKSWKWLNQRLKRRDITLRIFLCKGSFKRNSSKINNFKYGFINDFLNTPKHPSVSNSHVFYVDRALLTSSGVGGLVGIRETYLVSDCERRDARIGLVLRLTLWKGDE